MEKWKAHQNWPTNFARHLVEDVHSTFRRGFEGLKQKKNEKDFQRWNSSLHHHHTIEDNYFFPEVRKSCSAEIGAEIDILESDHRRLVELEKEIAKGDLDLIDDFVDALMDHLNREEILTIPLLLSGDVSVYL